MNESILNSVKECIGLGEDYIVPGFDATLEMEINAGFSELHQLGVGPDDGFYITGNVESWNEFIEDGRVQSLAREFIFLRAKVVFDPPQSSTVLESFKQRIEELKWRINVEVDKNEQQS